MADRPLAAPLAGIKVLEFSHTVMGPTAGLIFAEVLAANTKYAENFGEKDPLSAQMLSARTRFVANSSRPAIVAFSV